MVVDVLGLYKAKDESGDDVILRFGDTGKTVVRSLPADDTELEEHILYAADLDESAVTSQVGEVSNFQIAPDWSGNTDDLQAGDAFIYAGEDLL